MKTVVGLESIRATGSSAVTVGTFDGVHLGHRALIGRTIAMAGGNRSVAITWDRHPNVTLRPSQVPPLLSSPERKIELLDELGLDEVVVLAFDEAFSSWPPERFAQEVLAARLHADVVVVGSGWRFGHRARGDVALLVKLGADLGFVVEELGLTEVGGAPVSSSRTREAVAVGDMELARALLGRAFDLDGEVIQGDKRGMELGFPTANLALDPALAHPPRGVYAGRARVRDIWYPAAINLGVNPTFGGDPATDSLRVEAYLVDFAGDLYGQSLRVEFWKRLRDELKFDGRDALIEQMAKDVRATTSLVGGLRC